jgi:hypothetical protein
MPERMGRELFLNPAVQPSRFEARLYTAGIHGSCGNGGYELVSDWAGKQESRVAMSGPKASHDSVGHFRKRYVAIPATFAISDMNALV